MFGLVFTFRVAMDNLLFWVSVSVRVKNRTPLFAIATLKLHVPQCLTTGN